MSSFSPFRTALQCALPPHGRIPQGQAMARYPLSGGSLLRSPGSLRNPRARAPAIGRSRVVWYICLVYIIEQKNKK